VARATVCDLVERYLSTRPALKKSWVTPGGAAGSCCRASKDFAKWVRALGQKRKVQILLVAGPKKPCAEDAYCRTTSAAYGWERACEVCEMGHYVVDVDGCIVDLTARQFGANMPTIYPRAALDAAWRSIWVDEEESD